MDTSEQYIKMCDCPEIQGQKENFENGDWFAWFESVAGGKRGDLVIAIVGTTYYEFTRKEAIGRAGGDYFRLSTVGFDEGDCELGWKDKIIWLPRQDQIQEMYSKIVPQMQLSQINQVVNPDPFISVAKEQGQSVVEYEKFKAENLGRREYFKGYYSQFQTWEQLWLAFYVHEKHGKTWDGKEWVE